MPRIDFTLVVGVRAPIITGSYIVMDKTITVSYESHFNFGVGPIEIPKSVSTVFRISFEDKSGLISNKLMSKRAERLFPLYEMLEYINELFTAYKLVRIGHGEGTGIRTIGIDDVLFSWIWVDGKIVSTRVGIRLQQQDYPFLMPNAKHPEDGEGTTELAKPHIGTDTFPLARRFVRCFELIDHGFYTESLLVAFSILDDQVQEMLFSLLEDKGLDTRKEREQFIRSIKENRLANFLGPVLKVIGGKSLHEIWPESPKAIEWLNGQRNKVAHTGSRISHSIAKVALYTCLKTIISLKQGGYLKYEIPKEMYRTAKISAAWSESPPDWVPVGKEAESYEFN